MKCYILIFLIFKNFDSLLIFQIKNLCTSQILNNEDIFKEVLSDAKISRQPFWMETTLHGHSSEKTRVRENNKNAWLSQNMAEIK